MRAFIKNYIAAGKVRREEEGRDAGFSLIELIVVIVILGILIAIAIPVFLGVQDSARENAVKTAAANGATVAAAEIAQNDTAAGADFSSLENGDITLVAVVEGETSLTALCVGARGFTNVVHYAGPGSRTAENGTTSCVGGAALPAAPAAG
ncbi:type II secretion system protein [Microbacterium lacus]|uniref:type II secretion system protein n=1 Tax=Microbacterium lacus TaxID=415217 RepID=UPI0038515EFF